MTSALMAVGPTRNRVRTSRLQRTAKLSERDDKEIQFLWILVIATFALLVQSRSASGKLCLDQIPIQQITYFTMEIDT